MRCLIVEVAFRYKSYTANKASGEEAPSFDGAQHIVLDVDLLTACCRRRRTVPARRPCGEPPAKGEFRKLLLRYEKLERRFVALNHIAAAINAFRKVNSGFWLRTFAI